MNTNDRYLHRIAADIDQHGMAAVESDVSMIVDSARRAHIRPIAVSVLADRTEPEIARARAFGLVVSQLRRSVDHAPARIPAAAAL